MELTPKEIEDRKILDECKKEAFLKRGVPLAIFNGTAIYLAINSRKILLDFNNDNLVSSAVLNIPQLTGVKCLT